MKQVIEQSAALEELQLIEDDLGVTIDEDNRKRVARAIGRGLITYADGEFELKLVAPIALENGKTVDKITVAEPTAEQIKRATGDELTMSIKLIAAISGQPVGVIDRMKMRDLTNAGALLAFFG